MPNFGLLRFVILLSCLSLSLSGSGFGPSYYPSDKVLFVQGAVGSPSYARSNATFSLVNESFSFSFWVKRLNAGLNYDCAITHGTPENGMLACYRPNDPSSGKNNEFMITFEGSTLLSQAYPNDVGSWVHWAVTYNASARGGLGYRRLFRNGALESSDYAPADYLGTGPLIVGGGEWDMTIASSLAIDDVRLWVARVLDSSEAMLIFQNQAITWSPMTLWYSFDVLCCAGICTSTNYTCGQSDNYIPDLIGGILNFPYGVRGVLVGTASLHTLCTQTAQEAVNNVCVSPGSCYPGFTLSAAGNCTPCSRGTYKADAGGAACAACPPGTSTRAVGAASPAACEAYRSYLYNEVPTAPGLGPCELPGLDWEEVVARQNPSNQTSWTGGLGNYYTNVTKVWVCLATMYEVEECPSAPGDRACFVYNEVNRTFAYWGRDSYLHISPRPYR